MGRRLQAIGIWLLSSLLLGVPPAFAAMPVSDETAREWLNSWLKAQNTRDFKAYSRLYAEKFSGIRRSGAQVRMMNRERWLKDRKGMFAKAMRVEAQDIRIIPSPGLTIVTFEQDWESPSYHDTGPKQLVLARQSDGSIQVVREEMLRSDLLFRKPAESAETESTVHGRPVSVPLMVAERALLLYEGPDPTWGSGSLTPAKVDPSAAERNINSALLPQATRAWADRTVRLIGHHGEVCQAKVARLYAAGGASGLTTDANKEDENQVLQAKWSTAVNIGSLYLLADLAEADTTEWRRACRGAVWAAPIDVPTPTIAGKTSFDESMKTEGIHRFYALPESQRLQKEWQATGGQGPWGEGGLHTAGFVFSGKNSATYAAVWTRVEGACSDPFSGSLMGIWKVDKDSWTLLASMTEAVDLASAADANSDGRPEFFWDESSSPAGHNGAY